MRLTPPIFQLYRARRHSQKPMRVCRSREGEALSALWYLGRRQVTPATFERIAAKLPQVEFDALRNAKALMPAWMVEALRRYERGTVTALVFGEVICQDKKEKMTYRVDDREVSTEDPVRHEALDRRPRWSDPSIASTWAP